MKIRVIGTSNYNGEQQEVFFTEDLDSDVKEFTSPNLSVDFDEVCGFDVPVGFPLEHILKRE